MVAAGIGLDGQLVQVEGTGELARCLQHELDHLDGRLYLDRLSARDRRRVLAALSFRPMAQPTTGGAGRGLRG